MFLFGKPAIAKELRRRKIHVLLHSTHLYSNLPQILQDGRIDSGGALKQRYGPKQVVRFLHDPNRYERFTVGLDYINCSLTEPNHELFYKRSKSGWETEWVHLLLSVPLLSRTDTLFSPVSAAQDRGTHVSGGIDGFRSLFADHVGHCDRRQIEMNLPTHPQAEALVKGPISLSSVRSIRVFNQPIHEEVMRLARKFDQQVEVMLSPHLFVWPQRLKTKGDSF